MQKFMICTIFLFQGMLKSQLFRWGLKGFIGMVFGAVTFVVLTIIAGVACCHLRGMTGSTVRGGYIPASGGPNHNNTNSTLTESTYTSGMIDFRPNKLMCPSPCASRSMCQLHVSNSCAAFI